jgi:hypothetical protein
MPILSHSAVSRMMQGFGQLEERAGHARARSLAMRLNPFGVLAILLAAAVQAAVLAAAPVATNANRQVYETCSAASGAGPFKAPGGGKRHEACQLCVSCCDGSGGFPPRLAEVAFWIAPSALCGAVYEDRSGTPIGRDYSRQARAPPLPLPLNKRAIGMS